MSTWKWSGLSLPGGFSSIVVIDGRANRTFDGRRDEGGVDDMLIFDGGEWLPGVLVAVLIYYAFDMWIYDTVVQCLLTQPPNLR